MKKTFFQDMTGNLVEPQDADIIVQQEIEEGKITGSSTFIVKKEAKNET